MMTVLPIKLITEIDQPIFGVNLFNLAKLERLNFPVASGIAVYPPDIIFNTVLTHMQDVNQEVFEQRLVILKNHLQKIQIPEDLEKELKNQKTFIFKQEVIKSKNLLWKKLLEIWMEEIKLRIWQSGFTIGISFNLDPQTVFFQPKLKLFSFTKSLFVNAYFDPEISEVVIKSKEKLNPKVLQKIDQLVLDANKKLFIPQIYNLIVYDNKLLLLSLKPFTQTLPTSPISDIVVPKPEQKKLTKSAVKIFLNLSSGFAIHKQIDGILIEGEKVTGHDNIVFKLAEAALTIPEKTVIFKLPDLSSEEIRGTLRLIHQKSLLDENLNAYLFVRNKKNLFNIDLAIPLTRSIEEFLQLKRELAAKGLNRKGNLKFWMEIAVPENLININDYLEAGIDGVILDLDNLQKLLGGYDNDEGEFYCKQGQALLRFIKPYFKIFHKAKLQILAKGLICLNHEILDMLVEEGVFGIVVNTPMEVESLPEHLNWVEKRMILKKFA